MKAKRIISLTLIMAVLSICMDCVSASDTTKNVDGKEYVCVDLTPYANSISFDSKFDVNKKYTIPDYMGLGRDSDTQDLKHIYNKNAFDKKMDSDGLLYDSAGIPFKVATSVTDKNTILLGKGQYINKTSATIDIPEGKYVSFSFLADTLWDVEGFYFEMSVNYTDGTSTKDPNWTIARKNVSAEALLAYNGIESYIDFITSSSDPLNTGLMFRLEAYNPAVPEMDQWKLPVYTLPVDKTKTVKSITFQQTNDWREINIFALTGQKYSRADEIKSMIDSLPDADDIDFGNYAQYKAAVLEIQSAIEGGIVIDDERIAKLQAIVTKINNYDSNPAKGVKYLIDNMPEADNINESNYLQYTGTVSTVESNLADGVEIDEDRMLKFNGIKEKIAQLTKEHELKTLINSLPEASEISQKNYTLYIKTLNKIEEYITAGISADSELIEKYLAVKEAVIAVENEYDPYVTIDYSDSYNAIVYATSDITINDPECHTPLFIGTRQNDATVQFYPTKILNKKTFNAMRNDNGIIYSTINEVPFYIDTDGGVILGSNGAGKIHSIEIPVESGIYESISLALYGSYKIEPEMFEFKINYTDGSSTVDPDWLLPAPTASAGGFAGSCVDDYLSFIYDKNNPETTAAELSRNGEIYYTLASNIFSPVITLAADKTKVVKSISVTQTDEWRAIAIMGITCRLLSQTEAKRCIEGLIDGLNINRMLEDYDKIVALKNMLARYENSTGADEISNIEQFKAIENVFDSMVVKVDGASDITDYDKARVTFEFKNAVDTDNFKKYVSVKLNNNLFTEYEINALNDKTVELVFENDLNYDKKYDITISKTLPDKSMSGFILRKDYKYSFNPKAPMELKEFSVKDDKGAETELSQNSGKNITVSLALENNMAASGGYAVSVCLYDKDNKLVKAYMNQRYLAAGDMFEKTVQFYVPDNASSLRCFMLDGFTTMNKIWETVKK